MVFINDQLEIPDAELVFTASRSGGPGGQNVNKVSSRVTLTFDVVHSPRLSDDQKFLIEKHLGRRVSKEGVLQVVCQETPSQLENRRLALVRFAELIREALKRTPTRRKTKVPPSAKRRRLDQKKKRSAIKQSRSAKADDL